MHYDEALKLAGAQVISYRRFGSPTGHWWAKVRWRGDDAWAHGVFGACPQCDVIDSEIGEFYHRHQGVEKRVDGRLGDLHEDCERCREMSRRMLRIGREHLDNLLTQDEAELLAAKGSASPKIREQMVGWVRENAV